MNGTSPSRFPKNTSAGTFDRIFDAAAKGQSIRDASVDYRGSLTWLTETIYEVSGRDYHAQDEDKKNCQVS